MIKIKTLVLALTLLLVTRSHAFSRDKFDIKRDIDAVNKEYSKCIDGSNVIQRLCGTHSNLGSGDSLDEEKAAARSSRQQDREWSCSLEYNWRNDVCIAIRNLQLKPLISELSGNIH
jgi:hypothetical protein